MPVAITDNGDGTYAASYTPTLAGEASLVVALSGGGGGGGVGGTSPPAIIGAAPFAVLVSPGPPDARTSRAILDAATHTAYLVTAWVDVRDACGNAADPGAAAAVTAGVLRLGGAALPAVVEPGTEERGGVLLRVPPQLEGGGPALLSPLHAAGGAALEVTVGGRHVPGTPLAVRVVVGGGDEGKGAKPAPTTSVDASRAWAARAAAALAELGEVEEEEAGVTDASSSSSSLDPATAAYAAAHPGVPIVEDLADLWLVSRLQRERERKEAAAGGSKLEEVARVEMEAKKREEGMESA